MTQLPAADGVNTKPATEQLPESTSSEIAPPPDPPVTTTARVSPKVTLVEVMLSANWSACETVIVKMEVVAVAVLESVTRIEILDDPVALGVPEMTPVDVFSERPAGRDPDARANMFPPEPPDEVSDSE
jgi:hypothetical protein